MSFTTITFLAWLALVVLLYYRVPPTRRWWVILAANIWFYVSLDAKGILALAAASALSWYAALRIGRLQTMAADWKRANKALPKEERRAGLAVYEKREKRWVALAALAALGVLFQVKYHGELVQSLNQSAGLSLWRAENLLIPLGISYYSFFLISYVIDVYRTVIEPEKNVLRVFCFAGFFLSITQGPFGRYGELMPQIDQSPAFSGQRFWRGAKRMAWGYFMKMAVADRAAIITAYAFQDPMRCTGVQLAFAMACFGVQLYTDFCGYSHIMLGAGEILGLTLPENFRQPFFSRNMSEFWNRWHITLGAWLKDYVFYPVLQSAPMKALGTALKPKLGKKNAAQVQTYLALLILWFSIGLWHGAGFNYVFGVGLLQFCYIASGMLCAPLLKKANEVLHTEKFPLVWRIWQGIRCTLLMIFAWVFFQADSFGEALAFLRRMLTGFALSDVNLGSFTAMGVNRMGLLMLFYGVLLVFMVDLAHEKGLSLRDQLQKLPLLPKVLCYQLAMWSMAMLGIFLSTGSGTFLYARF